MAKQLNDFWNILRILIRIAPMAYPSDDSRIISELFQKGFVNLNEFVALTCALSSPITRLIYFEVTKILIGRQNND